MKPASLLFLAVAAYAGPIAAQVNEAQEAEGQPKTDPSTTSVEPEASSEDSSTPSSTTTSETKDSSPQVEEPGHSPPTTTTDDSPVDGPAHSATPPTSAQVAPPAQDDEGSKIRMLYEKGAAAYARGEYEEAFRFFSETHRRSEHPALLFNMAQAKRLQGPGHCLDAKRLYNSYLKQNEATPNRKEVLERLSGLEICAAEEEAALARKATAPTTAPPMPRPVPPLAKALTIGGGSVLAIGAGLFTASRIHYGQVEDECPCEPGRFSTWDTVQNISYGLMAAGGAATLAGGSWWWIRSRSAKAGPETSVTQFEAGIRSTF